MQLRLTILILIIFPALLFGQKSDSGNLKGKITTSDNQPAEYVSVQIKNSPIGTTTDKIGNFEIGKIKTGEYVILISLLGYSDQDTTIIIKQNETVDLKIQLRQTYAELQNIILEAFKQSNYAESNPSPSLRLNIPLNEIPQNITVANRELLTDQGLVTMSEAVRTVSGVQKNGGLNDIAFNIRGTENFFNIYRNGMGQYVWNQQDDIAMIEKIEFIKGPAGFIVSSLPPGGFVNIITKQPQRDPLASIKIENGSFNLFRLTTDWGGAFLKKSKFTYRFNAGLHHQQRAFLFSHAQRYFISGAIKYEPDKKNTITAEYNYMWGKTSGNNFNVPSLNGKLFSLPRNFTIADSKSDNLIADDSYFRLLATHQFNSDWSINLLLGNIHGKWGEGYQLLADPYTPVINDTIYRYAARDEWRSSYRLGQLYLNGTFHTGATIEHKLFSAFDYLNSGGTDPWGVTDSKFGISISNPDYYVNPDSLKTFSQNETYIFRVKSPTIYMEDHIKIREKLIFTLAGRLTHLINTRITDRTPDYQQQTRYNHFAPRFGVSWLFSEVSSAFIVYNQFFFPVFQRNFEHKPFRPSSGNNLEAGIKHFFFNKKLTTSLSVYKILINNALTPDPLHQGFYIQTAQYIHKGIEIDIAGNITPAFMVNANYAYTDARVSKGDAAQIGKKKIGTPDHSTNLWFKYKLLRGEFKGFSFALGYQYMGRRSATYVDDPGGNIYLPVYHLLDAALIYQNQRFNIVFNLYNITNINYVTWGFFNSYANEWRYTPGEPTNFRLSVGINLVGQKK